MKNLSSFLAFVVCTFSLVHARTIVEPTVGTAEIKYLQAEDGSDGADIKAVINEMTAEIPPNSEVWIPVGYFRPSDLHRVTFDAKGNSAQMSGFIEFMNAWRHSIPYVHTLRKNLAQGVFDIHFFKKGDGVGMVVRYKNVSVSTNSFTIKYEGTEKASWSYFTPTQEEIDSAVKVKAKLEIHTGHGDHANSGYAPNRGVYVNEDLTVSGNISANGSLLSGGFPVINLGNFNTHVGLYLDSNKYIKQDAQNYIATNGIKLGDAAAGALSLDVDDSTNSLKLNLKGEKSTFEVYNESGLPIFKAGEGHQALLPHGRGWYRIAKLESDHYKRANAEFTLRDDSADATHTTLNFRAGISFGSEIGMGVTVLSHTAYLHIPFEELRIVNAGIYSPSYLEVKVNANHANFPVRYNVTDNLSDNKSHTGWEPVDWEPVDDVPSEGVAHNYIVHNKVFMVGSSKETLGIDRRGSVGIEQLHVREETTLDGATTIEGTTTLNGDVIISQPQGDISMGIYGQ